MEIKVPIERQISQTVKCLVVEGKLNAYEDELNQIISAVYHNDCGVHCDEFSESSSITQTPHRKNRSLIHIGLLNRKQPLDIIWSILHEFGHVLQGASGLVNMEKDQP